MRTLWAVVLLCGTSVAVADVRLDRMLMGEREDVKAPRFAFTEKTAYVAPKDAVEASNELGNEDWMTARDVDSSSTDKKASWTSADLIPFETACGAAPCPPEPPPGPANWHATMLWDHGGKQPEVVVWHIARVVTGKAQKAAIKKGTMPAAIAKKIDGAEELVKAFEASIGDPKALAKTVSDRKDVVLYGNEAKERTVGGAKVKAKLAAWNLGFTVRDGIQAGLTSSKTVGWVAANVDAKSPKKPKDKPVPYRVLVIYEKQGTEWKLVNAHFSFVD